MTLLTASLVPALPGLPPRLRRLRPIPGTRAPASTSTTPCSPWRCSDGSAPSSSSTDCPKDSLLLAVGRANFAAAALVATASFLFAAELAGRRPRALPAVWLETALLAALSLWTPLVDRAETVRARPARRPLYGPLFTLYTLHVVGYLVGAVVVAFRAAPGAGDRHAPSSCWSAPASSPPPSSASPPTSSCPTGSATSGSSTPAPLSTILFLAAIGYAVFAAHLFSVRVIVRAAFVYAGLITLALELYQLAVTFLARLLPFGDREARGFAATAIALIVNAFTQQPVRRWLEKAVDRLASRRERDARHPGAGRTRL